MKLRLSQIILLGCAAAAFVPVLAVNPLLDIYIRAQESDRLQTSVDAVTQEAQAAVYGGINSIRAVLDKSPSLCTPTFIDNVHAQMQSNFMLRQILVENSDGVQYCDALGNLVVYSRLSQELSIPGKPEKLTVVRLANNATPVLKISHTLGGRIVSAFVRVTPYVINGMPSGLQDAMMFRMSLTNGTVILSLGDFGAFERRADDKSYIASSAFAGDIPLRSQAALVFSDLRGKYADLKLLITLFGAVLSGGLLLLALNYVRRSQLPAFDLENAIKNGELVPHYQPVIDLWTGQALGCEVLIRWIKPNGDVVPPGVFIDYAELTGLAIPITVNLMQAVRKDLSQISGALPDLKISINLFEGHFRDGSIVEDVQTIFGNSQISFRQLVFEITERRPITQSAEASSVIAGLHALGSRLAMDDVGTGHSNLAYIHTLGVDVIKIDRVFVDMVQPGVTQVPVLDGLIAMAHDLGAELVAEGVETVEQAFYLRGRGVHQAQGYLFAPALSAKKYIELVTRLNSEPLRPVTKGSAEPGSEENSGSHLDSESNAA